MKSFFIALHDCHDEARSILTWHHANKIKLHANKSEAQITNEKSPESPDEIFSSKFDQLVSNVKALKHE
jgi:NAD(P)H-dependent FMN reductase